MEVDVPDLFTGAATSATLQGWSVVDNTTGSDWTNVHLDLIAGAPQSFIQPLSTPYYTRRPEIPLPEEAQLAPQTHESGDVADTKEDGAPPAPVAMADASQTVTVDAQHIQNLPMAKRARPVSRGVLGGIGYGSGNGIGASAAASPIAPEAYQQMALQSLKPGTTTSAFDDYFQYSLTDPITIRKNESALCRSCRQSCRWSG